MLVHNVSHNDFFVSVKAIPADSLTSDTNNATGNDTDGITQSESRAQFDKGMQTEEMAPSIPRGNTGTSLSSGNDENTPSSASSLPKQPFAVPKFSAFNATSTAVLRYLRELRARKMPLEVIMHPSEVGIDYPIGLNLQPELMFPSWDDFKIRDQSLRLAGPKPGITGAIFPLISIILPKWHHFLTEKGIRGKKILILLSGSGTPRNREHKMSGNSTVNTARLIEAFVKILYPDITVVQLASPESIFRFDQNVRFMRSKLQPIINEERRKLAQTFDASWRNRFHLTLALAAGAPARVAALNAALRQYRPNYLHLFELKNLWFNGIVSTEDIDFFPFETAQVSPPVDRSSLQGLLAELTNEMRKHYTNFTKIRDGELGDAGHDLATFWLRKSRKPVLAVVAVQKEGDSHATFYKGMNMEVSMPTGSLCAERNAIGCALVNDPSLKRSDIKAVAVLSATLLPSASWKPVKANMQATASSGSATTTSYVSLPGRSQSNSITPEAKAAFDVMRKTHGKHQNHQNHLSVSLSPPRSPSSQRESFTKVESEKVFASPGSKRSLPAEVPLELDLNSSAQASPKSEKSKKLIDTQKRRQGNHATGSQSIQSVLMQQNSVQEHSEDLSLGRKLSSSNYHPDEDTPSDVHIRDIVPSPIVDEESSSSSLSDVSQAAAVLEPLRKGEEDKFARSKKETQPVFPSVSAQQVRDEGLGEGIDGSDVVLNPISPCGSCIEWLKKVEEVNPDLAVVTFTDTSCKRVYIRNVS